MLLLVLLPLHLQVDERDGGGSIRNTSNGVAHGAQTPGRGVGLCIGRRAAGASPDPPLPTRTCLSGLQW